MIEKDTFICARNSGDQAYLRWLYARMTRRYNEPEEIDYVQTLSSFVAYFERRSNAPRWLNFLLRKYDL